MVLDALRARKRIAPYIRRTPLIESAWLSDLAGARVGLKLESLQASGSFKIRGAFNAVMARMERGAIDRATTLVTASAGNHGRALAAAAEAYGLRLVVFTPHDAPRTKLSAIRRHGAALRAEGRDYDDAERRAKAFASESGGAFISPYNDPDVVCGAATVALEILEDAPDTEAVLVPIGGGGLVSGVAALFKEIDPAKLVVGVELEVSSAFLASVRAGKIVHIAAGASIAEGLGGNPDPDTITFGFIQRHVDRIVTVSERDLQAAVAGVVEAEHLIVEASAAAGVAALVGKRVDVSGRRVVIVLSGSNIDRDRLEALLRQPV